MPDETLTVELSLIAVPLPPEREEAYWQAIQILAELFCTYLNNSATSNAEWTD